MTRDAMQHILAIIRPEWFKSRIKRLRGYDRPQYRLRIDELRVFYDVIYVVAKGTVEILAIREKDEAMKWLAEQGVRTDETSTSE